MAAAAPRRIEIVPWGYWKAHTFDQGVIRGQSSGYLSGGIGAFDQTSTGGYVTWDVLLDAGTWAMDLIHSKANSLGIATPSLGGTDLATVDQYAASASDDNVTTWTGITVGTAGVYELKFRVDSKNGSSIDYRFQAQLIVLRRTGA